jgi:hypothetical protein
MQTELINSKIQHYSKNENGEYVLAHEEVVQIERPVGPVMTPQERIEQLEAKLEALLANNG